MSGCFGGLLILGGFVFVLASLVRWFDQVAEAVDQGWWNKVLVLLFFPFTVWFFPSRISAGRPTAFPRHEPVRGFGEKSSKPSLNASETSDQPPPGTPPEFMGLPKIPPKKPKAALDADKIAKLRQKMKDQGMLDQ
jgi:hypothetical protein